MPTTDIAALSEQLRENEEVLARSEVEARVRRVERVRIARALIDAGLTQQAVVEKINQQRLAAGATRLTVDAIQKALVRSAS